MQARLTGTLVLALTAALATPTEAQEQPKGGDLFGVPRPAAEGSGQESGREDQGVGPQVWFRDHLDKIDTSMHKFGQLSSVLGAASDELAADFDAYLEDPTDDLVASRIEKKMAIFAQQVVDEFDYVISDQDVIVANFKELTLKLDQLDDSIEDKLISYGQKLDGVREVVSGQEQTLIGLAIKVKEARDDREKRNAQREFARQYRRHRLKNRYVRQLERNLHNYQVLVRNLQQLTGLFTQLQDKFVALMEHLELEKEYLLEAIELQGESARIKKIMSDGILHGEKSITQVTEKLAMIYARVDAFTEVHDKLNMGLGGYFDTQETLGELSRKIDEIGDGGVGGPEAPQGIEDAIEHFASRRSEYRPSLDPEAQKQK